MKEGRKPKTHGKNTRKKREEKVHNWNERKRKKKDSQ